MFDYILNQIKLEWGIRKALNDHSNVSIRELEESYNIENTSHHQTWIGGKNRNPKNNQKNHNEKKEHILRTTLLSLYLIIKRSAKKPKTLWKSWVHIQIISDFNFYETIYEIIDRGITYQGPFKKYLPNGYGMCCFEKGEVYVGDFVNGEAESSRGVYIFFDGSYYEG